MKFIFFTAPWCPACQEMKEVFEKLKEKYPETKNITYDLSDINSLDAEEKYNIDEIPVFLVEDKNNILLRLEGKKTLTEIQVKLDKILNK